MRFVLLAEGQTEARVLPDFLSRWLNAQLPSRVRIQPDYFQGEAHFRREYVRKASKYLGSPSSNEIIAVIGLLDMYGLQFPNTCGTVEERYDWAKNKFEKDVGNPKFRMFFAVHELEAWILGVPSVLPQEVANSLPRSVNHPENVNFKEPPSKLLARLYQSKLNRRYKKIGDGENLFRQIDPREAAEKCPYLRRMLDALLEMAKGVQ